MGAVRLDLPMPLLAFAAYLATLAPGVLGLDSAELATGACSLGIVHPTGYPLYLLLAKAFTFLPFGSIAYRVNLLSAVCGATAVWLLARLGRRLTGERWAAWVAAGFLAFAYSFWRMSVVAEVYTLHIGFVVLILLLLELWEASRDRRVLDWLCLAYGLSLTNHVSGILMAPAIGWVILRTVTRRDLIRWIPRMAVLFGLGLTLYAYLPLRYRADPPLNYVRFYPWVDLTTPAGLLWMISGQAYRFFAFGYDLAGYVHELAAFAAQLLRNFTALGVLLGGLGIFNLIRRKHPLALPTISIFVLTVGFYTAYAVADKSTMFLPALLVWAVWVGEGAAATLRLVKRGSLLLPRQTRLLAPLLRASLVAVVAITCVANWRWADMSHAHEAEVYAREVLSTVPQGAMVVGAWSTAVILEYYQVIEGIRPDVLVFNRSRFEVAQYYSLWAAHVPHGQALVRILDEEKRMLSVAAATRPVYVMEYEPAFASDYEYQPDGTVFRLVPRPEARLDG